MFSSRTYIIVYIAYIIVYNYDLLVFEADLVYFVPINIHLSSHASDKQLYLFSKNI